MEPSAFFVNNSIFFSASSSFWLQNRTRRVPSSYFLRMSSSGNSALSMSATILSSRWIACSKLGPLTSVLWLAAFLLVFIHFRRRRYHRAELTIKHHGGNGTTCL